MPKSADAFRTISEVAEWLETPAHVLRFWESKFSQVKPVKRAGGRRYYRPTDMKLLGGIKKLLHEDGMTIKGVQKMLREQGIKQIAALSQPLDEVTDIVASEMAEDVIPEDISATVLSFQRTDAAPAGAEEETPPSEQTPTQEAEDAPPPMFFKHAVSEASVDATDATAPNASSDGAIAPEARAPAGTEPQDARGAAQPTLPTDGIPARDDAPSSDPAALPGFLNTAAQDGTTPVEKIAETAATDDTAAADPSAPAPLLVSVPDDPPDDMDADPGVLSALAARQSVSATLAGELADLAARLKSLHG